MIVAHLADTHLGCIGTGWQRTVPDPFASHLLIRHQEADIRLGFAQAVDRIVSLRPDVVIHAGDLFDHAHPTPHSIQFAFTQLKKLSETNIPVLLLEGDHSAPRMPAQGEPLQILGNLPGVTVVCGNSLQKIHIADAVVYALPHRALLYDEEAHNILIQDTADTKDIQILVSHGVADGLPFYQTHRSAASIRVKEVAPRFDYVALGHCHRFCQVMGTDRAFYSGCTAMSLASDFRPGTAYGFNRVILQKGYPPIVHRETITTTPMREYGLSDASGYSAGAIMEFLTQQIKASSPEGAYCRVVLTNIDPAVRGQIIVREIERLFPLTQVAGLSIQTHVRLATQAEQTAHTGQTPRDRFLERVNQEDIPEAMRDEIRELGGVLFDQADAQLRTEDQEAV